MPAPEAPDESAAEEGPELPRLPGFRDMAVRRRGAALADPVLADLARHRRESGLSQTEVAARMGTSQSTVARLEAGDTDPRLSTLERYARAVGRTLDWRLQAPGGEPSPPPDERRW